MTIIQTIFTEVHQTYVLHTPKCMYPKRRKLLKNRKFRGKNTYF